MTMAAPNYVRITFLPHGAKRRRTTWAIKLRESEGFLSYLACDRTGEVEKGIDGNTVQREVILTSPAEVVERPARMNLKYAELELADA